jgi:TolB protein
MPAWSPDTLQLMFASNKHGDRKWRIYAISPGAVRGEGDEWIYGHMPDWSPDGSQIAYHGCDERGDNCGVWLALAGGFESKRLTSDASDTAPVWSPDGNEIVYISARAGNWELYTVDIESGKETRLTEHSATDVAPTWSPDGRKVAFLSNREGGWAVYILDVRSDRVQKVIATGDGYPDPVSEQLSWIP